MRLYPFVCLIFACGVTAPAAAQSSDPAVRRLDSLIAIARGSAAADAFLAIMDAEKAIDSSNPTEIGRFAEQAARGYREVVKDSTQTTNLIYVGVVNYLSARKAARLTSAPGSEAALAQLRLSLLQAAQNARLIEQNNRIITLLEQLVKKP